MDTEKFVKPVMVDSIHMYIYTHTYVWIQRNLDASLDADMQIQQKSDALNVDLLRSKNELRTTPRA